MKQRGLIIQFNPSMWKKKTSRGGKKIPAPITTRLQNCNLDETFVILCPCVSFQSAWVINTETQRELHAVRASKVSKYSAEAFGANVILKLTGSWKGSLSFLSHSFIDKHKMFQYHSPPPIPLANKTSLCLASKVKRRTFLLLWDADNQLQLHNGAVLRGTWWPYLIKKKGLK